MFKKITPKESENFIFCTECGSSLSDFYLSKDVKDTIKLEEHYKNCKQTGKFKGEMCAKLFIALDFDLDSNDDLPDFR
ncbi:MAG: hypothetical protein LCH52_03590 [Bacteroidetes bacterium]|nr:hypothetical protein [Bacteroidota bacterium]